MRCHVFHLKLRSNDKESREVMQAHQGQECSSGRTRMRGAVTCSCGCRLERNRIEQGNSYLNADTCHHNEAITALTLIYITTRHLQALHRNSRLTFQTARNHVTSRGLSLKRIHPSGLSLRKLPGSCRRRVWQWDQVRRKDEYRCVLR